MRDTIARRRANRPDGDVYRRMRRQGLTRPRGRRRRGRVPALLFLAAVALAVVIVIGLLRA